MTLQRMLLLSATLATMPVLASGCSFVEDLFGDKKKDDDDDDKYAKQRDECLSNMKAIKTAQLSYDAAFDAYVDVTRFHPDSSPGKSQREFTTGSAFDTIGWMPDGKVRGSYKVVSMSTTDFMITCITDVDGDGKKASFTATKTINATRNTPKSVY